MIFILSFYVETNGNCPTSMECRQQWEILDFANLCYNDRKHTKDEFRHIDKLNKKYIKLLQETKDTNGKLKAEYNILKNYMLQELIKIIS